MAFLASTAERIFKKFGLEEKDCEVGGRVWVVPIARRRVGGDVGSKLRTWWSGREGCGKWWMEGFEARVDEKRLNWGLRRRDR